MTHISLKPFSHPERPRASVKIFEAIRYFKKLTEHKESTEYVFHIYDSLAGNFLVKDLKKFLSCEAGCARIEENIYLPDLLDDHDYLRGLPENTVGHAYYRFMRHQGYKAAGLVDTYDRFAQTIEVYDDQIQWYIHRQRDTHDLLHIISGYGPDAMGETCLQGFTWGQHKCLGALAIAIGGICELGPKTPKAIKMTKIVRQAYHNGRSAKLIALERVSDLLSESLDAARARLGIAPPTLYHAAHVTLRQSGIEPEDVLRDPSYPKLA